MPVGSRVRSPSDTNRHGWQPRPALLGRVVTSGSLRSELAKF